MAGSGWRKGCGSLFFLWVNFTGRPGNRVYAGANGLAILPSTVRRHHRRTTCRRHGMQRATRGSCGDSRERPARTQKRQHGRTCIHSLQQSMRGVSESQLGREAGIKPGPLLCGLYHKESAGSIPDRLPRLGRKGAGSLPGWVAGRQMAWQPERRHLQEWRLKRKQDT